MKIKSWSKLLAAILICQLAGIIGSLFTFSSIPTWYVTLNKPFFSPPNYLFGPVWIILYTLMGIAIYRIIVSSKKIGHIVNIFALHLILNTLWSIIFFGAKQIGWAFVEIVILWASIIYLIKLFRPVDKLAANLLLPYLAWVSFASVLNFSLWMLN
jgi:benzodiazapine receptor